jgi:hypothetical protein
LNVLAEELAFSQGVLIYALRLLRLVLLGGLAIGLPVVGSAAVRGGLPLADWADHSLLLAPNLEAKERDHCEGAWL